MNAQCWSITLSSQCSWIVRGRHTTGITPWLVCTITVVFCRPLSSSTGAAGGEVRSSSAPQLSSPRQEGRIAHYEVIDRMSEQNVLIGTTCCCFCCCSVIIEKEGFLKNGNRWSRFLTILMRSWTTQVTYRPLQFRWLTYSNLGRGYATDFSIFIVVFRSYKVPGSLVVWRLKLLLTFRLLMYIVRVSSLLLTPLQAVFGEKVLWALCYYVLVIFRNAVWGGGMYCTSFSLLLLLSPSSPPSRWQQTPCSCFCDSSIASNELRRIAEECQPLVMIPFSCCSAITPTP